MSESTEVIQTENEVENQVTDPEKTTVATDEQTESSAEKETPPAKTFTQEELDSILQKRLAKAEAKAERRAAQAYREALERVAPVRQETKVNDEPMRDQFANDADWIDAKVEHRLKQREAAQEAVKAQESQKTLAQKTETIYQEAEKIEGFDRDDFDLLPLTPYIAHALIESDDAPKLMHYMASNPDEVKRISAMSPARQAAEIGKIEAKLADAPKKEVRLSKAPDPIKPMGTGKAAVKSLDTSDFSEYKKLRAAQGARWSR